MYARDKLNSPRALSDVFVSDKGPRFALGK